MYQIIGADGKEYGPVTVDQLRTWVSQGRFNSQTRVRAGEADEWKIAGDVPELAVLFKPPPLSPIPPGPPPILSPLKPPSRDNSLAILSLVLGLCSFVVCLGFVAGVPALVCGHIARRRAKRQPERYGGSGMATAGLVLGYLSIVFSLVIASIVLPELARQRRRASQPAPAGCEYNLRQVGLAFKIWALDHNDQFPFNVSTNSGGTLERCAIGPDGFDSNAIMQFRAISNELNSPGFLVCPKDRARHAAPGFEELEALNVSYRLRTGTNVSPANPQEVLAVCPIHGNELHCNGEVLKTRDISKQSP